MNITKINEQFSSIKSQLIYGDIKQIALIANLERETVSRFINQKGDNVNTAIKVLKAANQYLETRNESVEALH